MSDVCKGLTPQLGSRCMWHRPLLLSGHEGLTALGGKAGTASPLALVDSSEEGGAGQHCRRAVTVPATSFLSSLWFQST